MKLLLGAAEKPQQYRQAKISPFMGLTAILNEGNPSGIQGILIKCTRPILMVNFEKP